MAEPGAIRGIVFADIVGSTRLFEQHGDAEAHRLIGRALENLTRVTLMHSGSVVKTIGDEVMSSFENVDAVFVAVSQMIPAILDDATLAEARIRIKAGFQVGEVVLTADDVFGDAVNVASRLAGLARAGQILTTAETAELLPSGSPLTVRNLGSIRVRGRTQPIELAELVWNVDSGIATVRKVASVQRSGPGVLTLEYRGAQVRIEESHVPFVLGRSGTSDLVVNHEAVSREHAKIDLGTDGFVLIDRSTNATFVTNDQQPDAVRVHRERIPLTGRGTIGLGVDPVVAADEDQGALVRYVFVR